MKKVVFIFLLLFLVIAMIEYKTKLVTIAELAGSEEKVSYPNFNFKHWFKGNYQENYNSYYSQNFGFRNLFIRLYNQFDYSLFQKPHANVVIGKEGYLFQENYLDDITGKSFIGKAEMKTKIEDLHYIENYLASRGKHLITILAPEKSYYFKEYIPDFYAKRISDTRNYEAILRFGRQENINLIDLNNWFLQLKDTCKLPLFSKQGIHWSYYGMALCVDTIVKYIESKTGREIGKISWTLEFPDTLRGTDYDLGDLMNIKTHLPYNKMPYPKFDVKADSSKKKLKILTIGDSFYWSIYYDSIFKKLFDDETFYYYCNTIYPKGKRESDCPVDLNFIKEIENYDIVLLLQSSANYNNPGVNFVQQFKKELQIRNESFANAKSAVINNESLFNRAKEFSLQNKISIDSAVSIVADSLVEFRVNEISKIKIEMRKNPEWMEQINHKSEDWGISPEDAMQKDAEWMYGQKGNLF